MIKAIKKAMLDMFTSDAGTSGGLLGPGTTSGPAKTVASGLPARRGEHLRCAYASQVSGVSGVSAGAQPQRSGRAAQQVLALLALLVGLLIIADPAAALAAPKAGAGLGDAALSHTGKSGAVVFWIFALALLGGSLFVITRRNLVTAVMGMVGTFFTLAALYAILYASFLAAIQVLVYAGAIMVLFVFVIMILNKPEAEPWSTTGVTGKIVTIGVLGYLLLRLVQVLWAVSAPDSAMAAPPAGFGSTHAIGDVLFTSYLFPFEAVSLVLLIAVVGAIAVARPHQRRPHALDSGSGGGSGGDAGAASS